MVTDQGPRSRVVVTGAAGLAGRVLIDRLADRYELLGLDRRKMPAIRSCRASLSQERRLRRAFKGADAVVHLAADASLRAPWDSVAANNIVGTRNVLVAAHEAGIRRVVFASSAAVTAGYEAEQPWADVVAGRYGDLDATTLPRISTTMPPRPTTWYAVSKLFGEAACRYHAETAGLSAVCLRIGSLRPTDRPTRLRHFATMVSHRDFAASVAAALEADVTFTTVYAVSANTWRLYDVSDANAIGFTPMDDAEQWRPTASLSSQ